MKSLKTKKSKVKTKTIHLRDLCTTGDDADDDDANDAADESFLGEDETNHKYSKSKFVVCFKSSLPNHFADVDSQIFDHEETCRNKRPCVDCETRRFNL